MIRLTETDKWSDDWFYTLTKHGKLLFFYLIENCDSAGFAKIVYRKISNDTGMTIDEVKEAFDEMEGKLLWSYNKTKIYIINFIEKQKNIPLFEYNKAHMSIIKKIKDQFAEFHGYEHYFENISYETKESRKDKVILTLENALYTSNPTYGNIKRRIENLSP